MLHPFFDGLTWPASRDDAQAFVQALVAAYSTGPAIEFVYRQAAPELAALNLGQGPKLIWIEALDNLVSSGQLRAFCEFLRAKGNRSPAFQAAVTAVLQAAPVEQLPLASAGANARGSRPNPAAGTMSVLAAALLSEALAGLYPERNDVERVLREAGLEFIATRVELERAGLSRWFDVLIYCSDTGNVAALVARLRLENHSPRLAQLLDDPSLLAVTVPGPGSVGERPVRLEAVPLPRLSLPKEQPLVDRAEDTVFLSAHLDSVLARSLDGPVQLVIQGESGVGKSRLVNYAMRRADELGMAVLRAQCLNRRSEPHQPIRQALNDYRGAMELPRLLEAAGLPPDMPLLGSFLGLAEPDTTRVVGTEDVNAAIMQLLVGLGARVGACLAVEDLNDADRDTLSLLEYLARAGLDCRVSTLMTVRDDDLEPDLRDRLATWTGPGHAVLSIGRLSRDDTATLVALLQTEAAPDPAWVEEVWQQTGGNPFFVEQLVRLSAEAPDAAVPGTGAVELPENVEAVVRRRLARIDATDPDLRWFLNAAAIALELTPDVELVAAVATIDFQQAAELRDRALAARLLVADTEGLLRFDQTVVRRGLLATIAAPAARAMHERAARWLEERDRDGSASHHYREAGLIADMVRTAVAGAEEAKQAGSYRAAAQLYRRAASAGFDEAITLDLARVLLVLGEWAEAESVLATLVAEPGAARVLRSELSFVRGDFEGALRELRRAIQAPGVDLTEAHMRLADIYLYLGRLDDAQREGSEALTTAGNPTAQSRCHAVIGISLYHRGDIDGAEDRYLAEIQVLPSAVEERDRFAYTISLHNLALVREARGDWPRALALHEEALRIRVEASAAREIGHSTHAVLRSHIALGNLDTARELLPYARAAAVALGDELEQGKLDQTEARLLLASGGDAGQAVDLVRRALERFRRLRVTYDIAHALLQLSVALEAAGVTRRAIEEGASGRAVLDAHGYGLLARQFPAIGFGYADRILAGLLAYGASDAVGLPWERMRPGEIDGDALPSLHATETWPAGATSDDTALTLLVAHHLIAARAADPAGFMGRLAEVADTIKGLGPSTTAAIEAFRSGRPAQVGGGNTNGALMRSLPIGWALPIDRADDRRDWSAELSRVTHHGPEAIVAACVGSALAAWALEGASPTVLLGIAREEATTAVAAHGASPRIEALLASIEAGTWQPDEAADEMEPYETLARVVACVTQEATLRAAVLRAVRMGGDTDTVAAIVGGILGCGRTAAEVRAELEWLDQVDLPSPDRLEAIAGGLRGLRLAFADG